ncbi:ABC-type Fe3+-hydroxamate transport system, periplasmic component [Idiomarina sp. A28L]|uniref:ABC transporter substrate-binding protein n=1 Tax=Idiomarina sp. A28L TaxID=1036674 RepID=UPI0002138BC2|nr:ABC transporter substrate-binding protein [Idiomarina sp. A28L]EGN74577.1 ABC-type Fe3+-hydroxamate transport system, periplasmic component [Idiomarina sp. A28L]
MRGTQFSIFPINTSSFTRALPKFSQQPMLALQFTSMVLLALLLASFAVAHAANSSQPNSSAIFNQGEEAIEESAQANENTDPVPQQKLRIVSMNYCIDYVLERWQNEHFEFYPVAEHHGRIEQIMQLKPDMIIAGQFNSPIRINNFRNNGLPVAVLDEPNSFAGSRRFFQELAELLQQPELAQADIAEISAPSGSSANEAYANKAYANEGRWPTVLAMQVNQWSFGGNNLLNELFQHMGLENLAARKGDGLVKVGLEDILQWQPDILLLEGKLVTSEVAAEANTHAAKQESCGDNQNPCVFQAQQSFALANLNLMHKSLRNYQQLPHVTALYLPREVSGCMAQRLPEAIHILSSQLAQDSEAASAAQLTSEQERENRP